MSRLSIVEFFSKKLQDSVTDETKRKADLYASLSEEDVRSIPADKFARMPYSAEEAERIGYSNYSYWGSTFRMFCRNKVAVFMLLLIVGMLVFAFIQPHIPGQKSAILINNYPEGTPNAGLPISNQRPSREFWFGTNAVGQDLWARVWAGTRTSLLMALIVAVFNCIVGITLGVLWGYVRKLDALLTEVYNIIDNIPRTIILILISYILRPGMTTMILAMCSVGWLGMARFIRNQVLMIRDREFNLASRCLGTSTGKIIFRNLLPYLVSVIMLQTALAIPSVISDEVFLTYCGLGMPKNVPSLGNLVEEGRKMMMTSSSYQLIFPALVVTFITVSFYLVGNAFADAADPRNHV
jgi:ABC-type dipeptide/oligopeptide/nickel transport systems, permease components